MCVCLSVCACVCVLECVSGSIKNEPVRSGYPVSSMHFYKFSNLVSIADITWLKYNGTTFVGIYPQGATKP